MLRIIAEGIQGVNLRLVPPPHSTRIIQLKELYENLRGTVPEPVTARDLLSDNMSADFIGRSHLDGVSPHPVNLIQREEYFAIILTYIAENNVEVAGISSGRPEYLCTLVSAITGPRLTYMSEAKQFDFISSIEGRNLNPRTFSVLIPDENVGWDHITNAWKDWEIAIAFEIGGGSDSGGGSYALYCRNEDHELWKWRYGFLTITRAAISTIKLKNFLASMLTSKKKQGRYKEVCYKYC